MNFSTSEESSDEETNYERIKKPKRDKNQKSMRGFLGSKSSKPSTTSSSKKTNLDQDDILSQMLFDVPTSNYSAHKPLKLSHTLKTKANFVEQTSVKKARVTSPNPAPIPEDIDSWQNDVFDDSLPPHEVPTIKKEPIQVDFTLDGDSIDHLSKDTGIDVIPLNEDIKSNIEFHDVEDDKKYARMYWYDCCEDQLKNPGVVYFFGRIYATTAKKYVSCCTIVKNVKRTCYLMIKDGCTYDDALGEFTHILAKRFKIKNFTCEKVTKKYAFSSKPNTPIEADYVKVEYPATQAALPTEISAETIVSVLNVSQTSMEKMILDLKLRGPCWLKMINPAAPSAQLTWTRIELVLESPEHLLVDTKSEDEKAPYFCTFSLSMRTYSNPTTHQNEIVAIAGMVNTCFNLDQCLKRNNKASGHFLIMAKPPPAHKDLRLPYDFQKKIKSYTRTRFELVDNERDLLTAFMDKFNNLDPDIVVGHDIFNFDYETLVMRMKVLKVGLWSKLGRFRRTELPATKAAFRYMFSGRVICDIRASAMELIHARSYDLTALTYQVLKKERIEFNHDNVKESYTTSEGLINMLNATWEDNDGIFSILVELNVIPLALKITNITGNVLSRTLAAGRSERNEYLLLHAFHEENFICPERQMSKYNKKAAVTASGEPKELAPTRKKAAYAGGLVLEPKTGYYDSCILLMDFNSLYPSIIQEFNICFSTVKAPDAIGLDNNAELIASVPDAEVGTGILPAQLRNLVDRRRKVKLLLSKSTSADEKMMLDIEQKALKLTANSMYGCLGFEYSRFYAKHLAALVTFKGREILMSTKAMVEKLGYEVIYGDTDSLMIDTKIKEYDEVITKGLSIKAEINRTFKLLEIDIDGVYRPLLLLKKKNYAGTVIKKLGDGNYETSIETKGLDTVRRDRAVIAKEAGEKVLSMILIGEKEIDSIVMDIHNYLKELGDSVRNGQNPNEKYLISKQLNRNPEDYRDTKGIGHVSLAIRYNSNPKNSRKMKSGDTVEYVICTNGTTESANQRAYSLQELAEDPALNLDHEYYLCQQIHPVMARICEKLPVTNAYVLAEMLGVEKSSLLHIKRDDSEGTKRDQLISKGESRYNSCKPLVILCPNCNLPDEISTRTRKYKDKKLQLSLTSCPQCGVPYSMRANSIVVQIIATIKKMTTEVYSGKYVCENTDCDYETRNVFCYLSNDGPSCASCDGQMGPEMDDRKMDLQLNYFKHLLEFVRENSVGLEQPRDDVIEMYKVCHREVDYALRNSFINNIDAHSMFSMVCSGR